MWSNIYGRGLLINKITKNGNFIYLLTLLTIWLLVHTIVSGKRRELARAHVLLNIILSTCVLLAMKTKSLLLFFIFFELRVMPISIIIFLYGYQPEKLQAALFLLIYTIIGGLPLLLFIILKPIPLFIASPVLSLPITLGFLIKTPIFLLHTWLPKAHVEAPVGGSMVLAGVLLKMGTYGLLLFLPYIKTNSLLVFYFVLSLVGSSVGAIICLRQGDLKVLVAYSSVVHMRVVRIGLIRGTEIGYTCALMMALAHGLCSPFIFAISYWLYGERHSRLMINNSRYWPLKAGLIMCLVALNIRVPPRLRLWSEVLIVISRLHFISCAFPGFIAIFFFGMVYNLYLYVSCNHTKLTNPRFDIRNSRLVACVQVCLLGLLPFFRLDLFHV